MAEETYEKHSQNPGSTSGEATEKSSGTTEETYEHGSENPEKTNGIYAFDEHKNKKRVIAASLANDRNTYTEEALTNAKYALENTNYIFGAAYLVIKDIKSAFDLIAQILKALDSATGGDGTTVKLVEQMQTDIDASLSAYMEDSTTYRTAISNQITALNSAIDKL